MFEMNIDVSILEKFETGLDPQHPEKSKVPANIIGYGEMSTIFEIKDPSLSGLAFKRLPIFQSTQELDQYEALYFEYNKLLQEKIGLTIPEYTCIRIIPTTGNMVAFDVQKKLLPESIANKVIHVLNEKDVQTLILGVLRQLKKIFVFNQTDPHIKLGIDGQISNWAVKDFNPNNPCINESAQFYYIDTSTPLIQKDGKEQLDAELFLRSAPSFMVWLVRWLFLEDVMTRYYDPHLVTVDLIANFYKEQLPQFIPGLIDVANKFFSQELPDIAPITEKEVRSYYREDAMIWRLYLALRRFDRFLHTTLLHKPYVYILPGKIKR